MLEYSPKEGPLFLYVDQSMEALAACLAETDGKALSCLFSLADDHQQHILRAQKDEVTKQLDSFTKVVEARIFEFNNEPDHIFRVEPDRLYTYMTRSDDYPQISAHLVSAVTLPEAMLYYSLGALAKKKYSQKNPLSGKFDGVEAWNWNVIQSIREELPLVMDKAKEFIQ